MKVLITGGAGFIGSHIADKLISLNHNVFIVDDLSTGKKENINPLVKFYFEKIQNDLDYIFQKEKPEIVIHAAAQAALRYSISHPTDDSSVNIEGTINVLESCRKKGVKKIIYTSTGGARFGEPKYIPVDEEHPQNPTSPYGLSKYTAEKYIEIYHKLYGIDYLVYCFGNVYGARDNDRNGRLITRVMNNIKAGFRPIIYGDGKQTRDYIYIKDVVSAIVDNLEFSNDCKVFCLASGKESSVNLVVSILSDLLKYKGGVKKVNNIKGEIRNIRLDISRAKRLLNWYPKYSLKNGIKEMVDYLAISEIRQ